MPLSTLSIRPLSFSEADYAVRLAFQHALEPGSTLTREQLQFWDNWWDPKYQQQTYVAEVTGTPVALGHWWEWNWHYQPGRYALAIQVLPTQRRHGIGSALYEYMVNQLRHNDPKLTVLMGHCREDQAESIHFMTKHGFVPTLRWQTAKLTVKDIEPDQFTDLDAIMHKQGIELLTQPQLVARDPDWQHKCYELTCRCQQDVALPAPFTPESFAQFVQHIFNNPDFLPDAYFVAVDQGEYVGIGSLINSHADAQHLEIGFAGVIPSHRQRGIATALIAKTIQYAAAHGVATIETESEARSPMHRIYQRFGFQRELVNLSFERTWPSDE
jgi:mycothiol synthase